MPWTETYSHLLPMQDPVPGLALGLVLSHMLGYTAVKEGEREDQDAEELHTVGDPVAEAEGGIGVVADAEKDHLEGSPDRVSLHSSSALEQDSHWPAV